MKPFLSSHTHTHETHARPPKEHTVVVVSHITVFLSWIILFIVLLMIPVAFGLIVCTILLKATDFNTTSAMTCKCVLVTSSISEQNPTTDDQWVVSTESNIFASLCQVGRFDFSNGARRYDFCHMICPSNRSISAMYSHVEHTILQQC